MDWTEVKSSFISHVGYETETQTLGVKFHTGAAHSYEGVHPIVHKELMAAESPGKYFHSNVRGIFETKRIASDVNRTV